jgi:phage terminase small subunit
MKLTAKQQRFIEEYLIDLNATQAAIRAGYSEKTAMEQGYQLLQKTSVKAEIERLQSETSKKLEVTKESLINDLLTIKDLCLTNPRVTHNSIKAIEVISKMLGFNAAEKQDISLSGPIDISKLIKFDDDKQTLND